VIGGVTGDGAECLPDDRAADLGGAGIVAWEHGAGEETGGDRQ
jgi:hypothetical protein